MNFILNSAFLTLLLQASLVSANPNALPSMPATHLHPITKDKFRLIEHAATLSEDIYAGYIEGGEVHDFLSSDHDDAVGVQDIDDYCFVVYRGTATDIDWIQNLDTDSVELEMGCNVHQGFHYAVANMLNETNPFIESCMAQEGKQLVFTGHSQGAAAAAIAALIYVDHNPLTIGFAQPFFLLEECMEINPGHFWRVANSENDHSFITGLNYDPVAFLAANSIISAAVAGPSVGPLLLLPPNTEGIDDPDPPQDSCVLRSASDPEPYMDTINFDIDFSAHSMRSHLHKINYLLNAMPNNGELDTTGFIVGTACKEDFECISGICGGDALCQATSVEVGDLCVLDSQCPSGARCNYEVELFDSACAMLGEAGEACNEDEDCLYGDCSWVSGCNECISDSDCSGQYDVCDGGWCDNLKAAGEGCIFDSECYSGECSFLRWWSPAKECE